MSSQYKIFGIRHHGPGSARALLAAFEHWKPDCILIEGPEDGQSAIAFVDDKMMEAPVALLVYGAKDLSLASFYPFAEFSPEWQAMRWALSKSIPVRFIDLPAAKQFFLGKNKKNEAEKLLQTAGAKLRRDPFSEMATLAGYSDSERFWEAVVERSVKESQTSESGDETLAEGSIFSAISEMMGALREANEGFDDDETLLREAHMRQGIRTAQKEGYQRIAVVCGAWHVPALEQVDAIKKSADAKVLRGLKKIKTATAWIPWSYDRLSMQSGYRAGVRPPMWYAYLFKYQAQATVHWMALAAQALRAEDLNASSAHVLEAVRLADTLATIRGTESPGIEELREAVISVLCDGAEAQMELIDRKVVVGEKIGKIPDSVPKAPLKADFEAQLKACRLKLSASPEVLNLDLRKAAHHKKSILLHRMQLLNIEWASTDTETESTKRKGSFHEDWLLHWLPDYEIKLIEMGIWGNTIEEAVRLYTQTNIPYKTKLEELVSLLERILKADLLDLLPELLQRLRDAAATTGDGLLLADALLPLVQVQRYGSARALDLAAVEDLIAEIVPRVCILLPNACIRIDVDQAKAIFKKILSVNRAIGIQNDSNYKAQWQRSLLQIAQSSQSAPALAGLASRLLYDIGKLSDAAIQLQLSGIRIGKATEMALWLEGFLNGSGMLLILQDNFRVLLDNWVRQLRHETFEEVLPLLRRAFSQFAAPEREKLLVLLKNKNSSSQLLQVKFKPELLKEIQPILVQLLA